jgi:GH18 family chitinase
MLILLNWKQTRTASFFLMIRIFAKKIIDILFYFISISHPQLSKKWIVHSVAVCFFFLIICFAFV